MQPTSFQLQRSPLTPEVVPLESMSGHSQHADSEADVHQTPNMAARLGKRISKKSQWAKSPWTFGWGKKKQEPNKDLPMATSICMTPNS